uniref:Phosphatidic acid phosphatase type 2/haloperoxidase domain-containing protein n=1 Tax=Fagus sylvatica TaxID=28930 RepID=A0A2N9EPP0_FAGSY
MSLTPTLLHRPSLKFFTSHPPELKSINSTFFVDSSSSKLSPFGGFVSKKGFFDKNSVLGPNNMFKLNKPCALKGDDGDKGVKVLQQEAFDNGSSKFGQEFLDDGLEATLNRLSKWLVAALFGGVILWRHDAEALWAAMGSVVNVMLSLKLKRILNQERPVSNLKSDPGMPSSHAQSIFFTVMFTILSIIEWLGMNEITITISALGLAFGSYLSWLRVSQLYHTLSQVVVGAVLGSIFSILWYLSWDAVVLKAFNSSFWVQAIVILGAAGFCLGFLVYVVRYWFKDEDEDEVSN